MSLYPSAIWKPLANTSRMPLTPDILALHTMVWDLWNCWPYFNTGAGGRGVYSHLLMGGIWGDDPDHDLDGVCWQGQDTAYRAAANYNGNYRIISLETADNMARPIAPWSPKQCTTIVRVMVDAHRLDGIPLVLVPDSMPGRRGIAYHRQGCDPYRAVGGELWSLAYGKDCPTDARIQQIPGLIEQARDIVYGGSAPTPLEVPEMSFEIVRGDKQPDVWLLSPGFVRQVRNVEEMNVLLTSPLCVNPDNKLHLTSQRYVDVAKNALRSSDYDTDLPDEPYSGPSAVEIAAAIKLLDSPPPTPEVV